MFEFNRDNRNTERRSLAIPVKVDVRENPFETWSETSTFKDVSEAGGGFRLSRPVKAGRLIELSTDLPRELRRYDVDQQFYGVWAIVRRCIQIKRVKGEPFYAVGAAFIGRMPPSLYFQNPLELWDLAETQPSAEGFWGISKKHDPFGGDGSSQPRRHSRLNIPEELCLEFADEQGVVTASEATVTENISSGGASVLTQSVPQNGTFLRAVFKRTGDAHISIVRGHSVGVDGIRRLHLEFIDRPFPLEGLI